MTRKTIFILMMAFCLAGCVTTQQYASAPPSVSQMQGQCLAKFQKFLDQTACIENGIASYSYAQPNPFTQEYIAYMQSLSTKVSARKVSEDDARVQLTQRLNDLRQKQNNEFAQQEALANQRAAQTQKILQRNKQPLLNPDDLIIRPHLRTNCQTYGNQTDCTTY